MAATLVLLPMLGVMVAVLGGIESVQSKNSFKECMARSADTILHEFAASMLMLTLFTVLLAFFFPFGAAAVWPMHAVGVFIFNTLTPGACANPAFTVGLYVFGKINAYTVIAGFLGQVWASRIAFPLMSVIPFARDMLSRSAAVAPSTALPLLEACVGEGTLTALFVGSALFISNRVRSSHAQHGIVAAVLRLCFVLGQGRTGACMNPLGALCWLLYSTQGKDFQSPQWEYVLVYILSPVVGASLAAAAVTSVNVAFPVAESTTNADSPLVVPATGPTIAKVQTAAVTTHATPSKAKAKRGASKGKGGLDRDEKRQDEQGVAATQARPEPQLVAAESQQVEQKAVRRRRKQ